MPSFDITSEADLVALKNAVDALRKKNIDSDGDGTSDIDELMAGGNPNASNTAPSLQFGCSAAGGFGLTFLGLGALFVAHLRRKQKSTGL